MLKVTNSPRRVGTAASVHPLLEVDDVKPPQTEEFDHEHELEHASTAASHGL